MAQRISRAKATIRRAGARFETPTPEEQVERLPSVLRVLYLVFNEGYAGPSRDDGQRVELSREAIRLTRMVHRAVPEDAETAGLLALMLLVEARRPARVDERGRFVPLCRPGPHPLGPGRRRRGRGRARRRDRFRSRRGVPAPGRDRRRARPRHRRGIDRLGAHLGAVRAARAGDRQPGRHPQQGRRRGHGQRSGRRAGGRRPGGAPAARTTRGCSPSVPTCTSSTATRTRRTPTCARPPPSPPTAGNATTSSPRRPGCGGTPVPTPDGDRPSTPHLPASRDRGLRPGVRPAANVGACERSQEWRRWWCLVALSGVSGPASAGRRPLRAGARGGGAAEHRRGDGRRHAGRRPAVHAPRTPAWSPPAA